MAKRRKYALSDSSDSSSVEIIQNNDLSLDNQPILGEYCLVKIIPSNKRRCPQFHYENVFSGKLTVLPFKSWGKEAIYLKCECSITKLCKFSATIEPNSAICENYIHMNTYITCMSSWQSLLPPYSSFLEQCCSGEQHTRYLSIRSCQYSCCSEQAAQ